MEEYAAWQDLAVHDLKTTDLSYEEIAKKYGRARDTVIKLARLHNLIGNRAVSRNGPRKMADLKPLSREHRTVGVRLTLYRGTRSYTEVAQELNVSRHCLKAMEIGAHDFTLSQMIKISELIGMSINDVVKSVQVMGSPQNM
jgi:DNA-binding XRE family transcriptional regulator